MARIKTKTFRRGPKSWGLSRPIRPRSKDYQRLLNSRRWKELRAWKLQQNPLCELCAAEDRVVAAVDVHHLTPCESCHSLCELEETCFNPSNLQALCIPCHIKVHQELRSHTTEGHRQRQADRLERWKERQSKPRGGHLVSG